MFRIFDGIQSVEMHNNVIDVTAGGTARIERTVEAVWANGRQIRGSNNWIESGSTYVPGAGEWTGTLNGTKPGFANAGAFDFMPTTASALYNTGNVAPATNVSFPFPSPLSCRPINRAGNWSRSARIATTRGRPDTTSAHSNRLAT